MLINIVAITTVAAPIIIICYKIYNSEPEPNNYNSVKDTLSKYKDSSIIDILNNNCLKIDKINNSYKYTPSKNPYYIKQMKEKNAIRCTVLNCNENVLYKYIQNNISSCQKCTCECIVCKELFHPDEMSHGLYKHSCINCTRCERCNAIMWDYVCSNCGY